jgi:hypothetical protein
MYTQGRGIGAGRQGAVIPPDVIHGAPTYYLIEVMKIRKQDGEAYFKLAESFIDEFVKTSKFTLMAAGYLEDEKNQQLIISHLWSLPDANQLWKVMSYLGTSNTYCKIDDLVSKTDFEIQDIAVGFGSHPVDDRPNPKTESFKYVVADYHQWTNGVSGWDLEFDAGYPAFLQTNPEWTHLGNRMAITGSIYRLQQIWMVPSEQAATAEQTLVASDWGKQGYRPKRVLAFEPTRYDVRKR